MVFGLLTARGKDVVKQVYNPKFCRSKILLLVSKSVANIITLQNRIVKKYGHYVRL